MERALKGKGFIKEKKERQGPKGKIAFLLRLPRNQNRGGGRGRQFPASQDLAEVMEGAKARGGRGLLIPPPISG